MTARQFARLGGVCAIAAIPVLILSGFAIALFFGGYGDMYGSLNDLAVAIVAVLLIPAVAALDRATRAGDGAGRVPGARWFRGLSALAELGLALIAVGQVALVGRAISLEGSFATGGIGVLPVIAWIAAVAWLVVRGGGTGRPVRRLGWSAGAVLLGIVVTSVASATPSAPLIGVTGALMLAALCWFLWTLGTLLRAHASAPEGAAEAAGATA